MRAIRMRVRDASLRSTRAGPCGGECRGNALRCPICHSEEHQRRRIYSKFETRFFASLRMTNEMISAYPQADVLCRPFRHFPQRRDCAGRAERGSAHSSVRRGGQTNFGGWDSKGKGGFVKSPSLWRAFLPLLSARAERRGPRRVFPLRRLKKSASRKHRKRADEGIGPYGRRVGQMRAHPPHLSF